MNHERNNVFPIVEGFDWYISKKQQADSGYLVLFTILMGLTVLKSTIGIPTGRRGNELTPWKGRASSLHG